MYLSLVFQACLILVFIHVLVYRIDFLIFVPAFLGLLPLAANADGTAVLLAGNDWFTGLMFCLYIFTL